MSSSDVEAIGLAEPPGEALDSADSADSLAEPTRQGDHSKTPRVVKPTAKPPPREKRRPHPILLLVLLLAVAGLALAVGNQFQRAQQLEGQVAVLDGELSSVRGELARARDDLVAYERRMDGVRSAVADLSGRMSALRTLVNEPASASPQP